MASTSIKNLNTSVSVVSPRVQWVRLGFNGYLVRTPATTVHHRFFLDAFFLLFFFAVFFVADLFAVAFFFAAFFFTGLRAGLRAGVAFFFVFFFTTFFPGFLLTAFEAFFF